ncbi:glycosyltransferase, partial [Lactobacillus iners]|nr:glycosyltransferase [Lactobacillus iners]
LYPGSSIFGWASMVCIILLLGGLQLLCIGILGKYIGRVYIQVKNRPIYIIKEKK